MIRFDVKLDNFKRETNKILKTLDGLPSVNNISMISRAGGSVAAKAFVKDLNREARANKKRYHHLYEWERTGVDAARLIRIKKSASSAGNIFIYTEFKKSRTPVPISKILQKPGATGKSVTKRSVFKNKAEVMENQIPVSFVPKKTIAFAPNGRRIIFRDKPTLIYIKRPGGSTKNALQSYTKRWQGSMLRASVLNSGLLENVSKDIIKTMQRGDYSSTSVSQCIRKVCEKYDMSIREF